MADILNDPQQREIDATEEKEWLESLDYVIKHGGPDRVQALLRTLQRRAAQFGIHLPYNTPYTNTISRQDQPRFPGQRAIERRIKSIVRWNAMAMVVRANRGESGIGGHISTYASAATLYEVAFNHIFHGPDHPDGGDQIYFQGHASPGIYARAFLEGRLSEEKLENFRRENKPGGGLPSYPHPRSMPDFWEFPTVSMGLGPLMSIYQARFNRYLEDRGLKEKTGRVFAFLGDGETDEPESLGSISLAAREGLDNLTFVINCNLQRLDGPVRGNGKIIQELEAVFRGAGWNVVKVIWGDSWDPLLAQDVDGLLVKRMESAVDGDYQKLHPRALLRYRPAVGQDGRTPHRRAGQQAASRWPRPRKGLCGLQGGGRSQGRADGRVGQDGQGLRARRGRRGQEHHALAEETERGRAARVPRSLRHPDQRRGGRRGAVLQTAGRQPGDDLPARAPRRAGRFRAVAHRGRRAAGLARRRPVRRVPRIRRP
jgi:transketolase N-terminal domain/subunit